MACAAALALTSLLLAAAPEVSVQPASVVLGTGEAVRVHVRSQGTAQLKGAATVGTLVPGASLTAEEQDWLWQPPATKAPATALLLFWRDEGALPDLTALRIPMSGRTDLEVDTEPEAAVRVEVGKASFGPQRADARGKATVSIEVAPGVTTAKVVAVSNGQALTRTVKLDVPAPNPLAAVIAPSLLDPKLGGWLFIVHSERLDVERLELDVEGGALTRVAAREDRALYRLMPSATQGVTIQARLRGDAAAKAAAQASVTQPPPAPPPPEPHGRFVPSATVGGFYAGGTSGGPAVNLSFGVRLPFGAERFLGELNVGFKSGFLSGTDLLLGGFRSSVAAVPVVVSIRARPLERERWAIDGRLGGGIVPFSHTTQPELPQRAFSESGLGFEVFIAGQATYRMSPLELFLEAKIGASPIATSRLRTDAGGVALSLGVRYEIR